MLMTLFEALWSEDENDTKWVPRLICFLSDRTRPRKNGRGFFFPQKRDDTEIDGLQVGWPWFPLVSGHMAVAVVIIHTSQMAFPWALVERTGQRSPLVSFRTDLSLTNREQANKSPVQQTVLFVPECAEHRCDHMKADEICTCCFYIFIMQHINQTMRLFILYFVF